MALPLSNSFAGGTSGTTITTGNSGGASGNAFDSVSITNAAAAYSATHAIHSPLSCAFSTTTGSASVTWSTSLGTQAVIFGRAYVYLTANPGTDDNIINFFNGGSFGGGIMIASSGQLRLQTASFGETGNFSVALNQFFRLEWKIVFGTAGNASATVNYYSTPDSPVITNTLTDSAGAYGNAGSANTVNFGWTSTHPSQPVMYLDGLQLNATGFPGPALSSSILLHPGLI